MKRTLLYDMPVEVSKEEYNIIMTKAPGTCAGQEDNGKYFVKCWYMAEAERLENFLNRDL